MESRDKRLFKDWISKDPLKGILTGHTSSEWRKIVAAVEAVVPLYEPISESISLGLAGWLRRRAVEWLWAAREGWTLDLGTGPGVSSRLLLSSGFEKVVGLDPSVRLLSFTRAKLGRSFHPVVGVSESLPFRDECFAGVLSCFALRDVKDPDGSLEEVSRAATKGARVGIVDVGKPDGDLRREIVWLYLKFGMPLISKLLIRGRLSGNPFKMIIPTFQRLYPNGRIAVLVGQVLGWSTMTEFMLGGLMIIRAKKLAGRPRGFIEASSGYPSRA